ncbi:hypothetical protein TRFO_08024 [Tritrichomonas foetus]|uniref:Uncharacterized protein n=1 Tax=Tritrichomonas foetus TaxID=1144522 RepID=A0A1J4JS68_9EUKA|nr:hypothetical protein TRFO_08024 [Tritrichomonas foetus]|eukprot:OHT00350.1 hypothetical protein TRFO_08024 [Tritrichomonas foetus]
MNHSQFVYAKSPQILEDLDDPRVSKTPQPSSRPPSSPNYSKALTEINLMSNKIMLLSLKNAAQRKKCNKYEANLETITRAINNNVDELSSIVFSIEEDNENLKQEIEKRKLLMDKINEIRNQSDNYFDNLIDTADFLSRCHILQKKIERIRKIQQEQNSDSNKQTFMELRKRLSALKQRNAAEHAKLGYHMLLLNEEKDKLLQQIEKAKS